MHDDDMDNTTNLITDLRAESHAAGDDATYILCDIALEYEPVILSANDWEEYYGGGGYDLRTRRTVLLHGHTVESAIAQCLLIIAAAATAA
jgi:hypothetical protein